MYDVLEKVKKTITYLTPAVVGIGAVWGWDGAAVASATETVILAILQYVQFFCKNK